MTNKKPIDKEYLIASLKDFDEKILLSKYVKAIEGMGLSANDFTDELKEMLLGIEEGAEVNIIDTIKINGEEVPVNDKSVDITVPEGTSVDLTGYLKEDDIVEMSSEKLKAIWDSKFV